MDYQSYREELTRRKTENDELIADIKNRLTRYNKKYVKKKGFFWRLFHKTPKGKSTEEKLLSQFSDRRGLVCPFIKDKGEGYFQKRIENEKSFKSYAEEFSSLLENLEKVALEKGKDADVQKQRLLGVMTEKTEAWLKNKTQYWREDMQETVLKSELIALFDQTIDDLKLFADGSSAMKNAEGKEDARLADKTRKDLEKYREIILGCSLLDTDGNYYIADDIREELATIRKDLPKMASERIVKSALTQVDKLTMELKAEKNEGRTLGIYKKLKPFAVANEKTLLSKEKIDELSASVFVLERLTINQDFFDAMDARIQRKVESLSMPHDFATDETYLSLKAKATECAKEIRKLKADPKCSKMKLAGYVELLKACDGQIKDYESKKLKEVRASVEASKEIARLQKTCASFKEVGEIFTSKSGVSYLERAKIMAETQTYDFRKMYEEFVSALLNGEKDTLLSIRAKLQAMVEEFNTRRGRDILSEVEEAEREAEAFGFDMEGVYADPDTVIDESALDDLLGEYDDEPATPVQEQPVKEAEGKVETVNTEEYASDELSKKIQGIFDDLKDL